MSDMCGVIRSLSLEDWARLATILGVVVAITAGGIAWVQIVQARRVQKEATARQTYATYLQFAFANPTLAQPAAGATPSAENHWFVAFMLLACEQVLEVYPDDPAWLEVVLDQLRYHRTYLKGDAATPPMIKLEYYSKALQDLIRQV